MQKEEKRERDHKLPISEMKQGITTDYKHQKVNEKYYKQACIQHVTALMIQISKSRKMQKTPNGKSGTHGKFIKSLTKNWMSLQNNLFQNKEQKETLNEARITLLPKKRHCKKKKEYYIQLFLINIHVKIHNKTLQKEFSNKFVII